MEKKRAKAAERKRKNKEKTASGPKKKKKKNETDDDDNSDISEESPSVELTVYVFIPKKVLPGPPKGRGKPPTGDDYLSRGPFTISSSNSYETFLSKLAGCLPCRIENIHQSKLEWKPKKPGNAPKLTVGGKIGYPAMISEIRDKKSADHVMLLFMPPPAEPMVEATVCFVLFVFGHVHMCYLLSLGRRVTKMTGSPCVHLITWT